ncbi:hypothetical protein VPGG_00049 [Vibrio phage VBM1]|uniref:tail fiber protein n=1 Tax=Vibrio phage VBM1 TaxID=754074 RepID=UPI0002C09302|nr:tail fiber protein [Vibrio phage VBM1]AGH07366.1 hypothetical protein VPGG_00049 [Vibrio phage VBM1]
MTIQVTGIIEGPLGSPSPGITIRVVSKISYRDTCRLSTEDHVTTTGGAYDFQLNEGFHKISIRYRGASSFVKLGDVSVSDQTPSPISLINLLESSSPKALVVKLQELADEASESAKSASDDADQVALDKQAVTQLAQQVSDDADQVALDKAAAAQSEANAVQSVGAAQQSASNAAGSATSAAQSEANINAAVTEAQNDIVGGSIFKGSNGEAVEVGDFVKPGITHLRVLVDGKAKVVGINPRESGVVSQLTDLNATINGVTVDFIFNNFTLRFDSIANMLAGIPVRSEPGDICIVLDTSFKHESGSGFTITDFTPLSERGAQAYQVNNMEELRNAVGDRNDNPVRQYGSRHLINNPSSTHPIVDVANFAGQTLGVAAPTGWIHHHYTDGIMHQFDNVGYNNTILVLKNAQNPTRRPDKPSDFVGSGNFISLRYVDPTAGFTRTGFFIDKDMKQVWTGEKGTAVLWQNKQNDGLPAFRLQTTHKHDVILDIMNGLTQSRILQFKNDVGGERFLINSLSELENGVGFQADAGDVWLLSLQDASGRIKISHPIQASDATKNTQLTAPANKAVEVLTPFKPRQYSTATLPSASTFSDCLLSISDSAGKPSPLVYSDGTNWRYMDNTIV